MADTLGTSRHFSFVTHTFHLGLSSSSKGMLRTRQNGVKLPVRPTDTLTAFWRVRTIISLGALYAFHAPLQGGTQIYRGNVVAATASNRLARFRS
jgi:hypothetical protein